MMCYKRHNVILIFLKGAKMIQKISTTQDVVRKFCISYRQLEHLFQKGALQREEFQIISGRRIYTEKDMRKIEKALRSIRKSKIRRSKNE
ncbi:MAG: hypothetical protein SCARUB_01195 [Candidatus Scalindua rubra]|uniref:HTH merR-type domain-containing protein n=1 Tax=Candidatus Scalindua rubra TaxID=1872076 RepID=A0A1E3XDF8_9BACT|nr:MAG: hypothetical protein SCARUB_01195 [Candidatus Scalindua rubra]